MASKKLPKDLDLAKKLNPADGFFSAPAESTPNQPETEKITAPTESSNAIKNVGGRPQKEGLKNEQFTLTMDPELYEKLRIIAKEECRGNFSGLIDECIKSYCRENSIDLSEITVDHEILEIYRKKQEKKKSKKK